MSDEYSDETYSAWLAFSAAVRDRSRDWLRIGPTVNPLQALANVTRAQSALMYMQTAQYKHTLETNRRYYSSPLGSLFGGLI